MQQRHGRHVRIGIFKDCPEEDCYHCDISTRAGFERGMALIKKLKPRWLFCSPPCTAHCPLQMLNAYKSEENWWRLINKQKKSRKIYKACCAYIEEVVKGQKNNAMFETFNGTGVSTPKGRLEATSAVVVPAQQLFVGPP